MNEKGKMLHSWQIIGSVSFTLKSRYNQNLEKAKILEKTVSERTVLETPPPPSPPCIYRATHKG